MDHTFLQNIFNNDGKVPSKPKLSPDEAQHNRKLEQAWKAYQSQRFCPPLTLLAQQTEDVLLHMSVCPMCQQRYKELIATDIHVNDFGIKQDTTPATIEKGNIYKLSTKLEGFDESYQYILAPQVLALEVKQQVATVAIVSTSLAFTKVSNRNALLPHYAFVETWNTFDIPLWLLSAQVVSLSDEEMHNVQRIMLEPFHIAHNDTWSKEFMQNERELAEIIKTRAACLCVSKKKAWNWKTTCADLFSTVKELFTLPAPALHAASDGDRVDIHIKTPSGIKRGHANITLCNNENGYMELEMHLPKDTAIEHIIIFAENEDGIISADADTDGNICYAKFKEDTLHDDSAITIILTTKD